jgi:multiple antibiotic resistance protein
MTDDMEQFSILAAMDNSVLKFGLTAFATLLVVVDPFGVLPIFISLAKNRSPRERTGIATRAVVLGFMISLFFLVAGHSALAFLGVSVHAFSHCSLPRLAAALPNLPQ